MLYPILIGPTGPQGAASTVPGPQGPQGAASTVPGPTGPTGQPGPTGASGPAASFPYGQTGQYLTNTGGTGVTWSDLPTLPLSDAGSGIIQLDSGYDITGDAWTINADGSANISVSVTTDSLYADHVNAVDVNASNSISCGGSGAFSVNSAGFVNAPQVHATGVYASTISAYNSINCGATGQVVIDQYGNGYFANSISTNYATVNAQLSVGPSGHCIVNGSNGDAYFSGTVTSGSNLFAGNDVIASHDVISQGGALRASVVGPTGGGTAINLDYRTLHDGAGVTALYFNDANNVQVTNLYATNTVTGAYAAIGTQLTVGPSGYTTIDNGGNVYTGSVNAQTLNGKAFGPYYCASSDPGPPIPNDTITFWANGSTMFFRYKDNTGSNFNGVVGDMTPEA